MATSKPSGKVAGTSVLGSLVLFLLCCVFSVPVLTSLAYSHCLPCHEFIIIILPIASCGLKLDDEAVRVAVGLRLGFNLCVLHQCRCGAPVDASGLHSFVCKQTPGKTARHHALNNVVARASAAAGIPVC